MDGWKDSLRTVLLVGLGALPLLGPALWNGYPLFFFDSFEYVPLPFTGELPVYRTAGYGLFAWIGRLTGSLWPIIVVQCLLVAFVLLAFARAVAGVGRSGAAYAVLLAAAAAGGLPWYTGQVMADGLTGAVILGLLTLLLFRDRLPLSWATLVAAVVAVGIASHTSHVGIAGGLLLLGFAAAALGRLRPGWLPPVRTGLPAVTLAAGLMLAVGANWTATGRLFLVQPSTVQTLALFVENGLAARYLDAVCPGREPPPHALCAHRGALPHSANEFLWGHSPFRALGGWDGLRPEAEAIVDGVRSRYPGALLWQSARFTGRQFAMMRLGDGLVPMQFLMRGPVAEHYPAELAAFEAARQQQGEITFPFWNPLLSVLWWGGLGGLVLLVAGRWRAGCRRQSILALGVLAALAGNAFICGALSNPNQRYQGRLAWMPVALVGLLLTAGDGRGAVAPAVSGALRGEGERRRIG
ncbi:hypothetical protein RC1_0151 [Rhodospirillum centenum SW]|uniref:Glycosyltransferase RgtA/B/C/D-like domain-containing protein n=1 Tax=Rhodospirillum centenum (strain ATCC 51521 / SW) TaxID=414684 RepID=B6IQ65_RHOCS|nr:hypothetical protein RC1_0151 [Rhodospirillum centenum SW]